MLGLCVLLFSAGSIAIAIAIGYGNGAPTAALASSWVIFAAMAILVVMTLLREYKIRQALRTPLD